MDNNALREFLQKKYENPEAFLANVIFPVFGEDNYDTAGNYHWLRRHPEDQIAADNAGILDILVLGSIFVEGSQLDVFDVTIESKRQLTNNRVGIQQLIRRIISTHSGAFIIFHYKSSDRWDWRFTFCHKGASQLDSTDAKRYTFLLGPGQSCRTAADNFCKLGKTVSETGSFTIKDVIDAFDVEALSIEFFGKYKEQYVKFVSYMADDSNGMRASFIDTAFDRTGHTEEEIRSREEKPLRDYVKKLLGRIVFLYFIQKKGWLGVEPGKDWGEGDMEFMLHLFEKASEEQKANFLDAVLEPLFEDGLNTNRSNNGHLFDTGVKALPNGGVLKVPYLNGGLFERDASDEPDSVFPAEYFKSLLTFLSQYNFTIDENDPNDAQVGIDPEMLGRIFENLLEDNKDKGTFYTPKEIVQYMCKESIISFLQTDKNDQDKQLIRDFVLTYDTTLLPYALRLEIDQKLKNVKVCDPAIGSGAFPMGILKEIFYCRGAIENFEEAARIKKEIINKNLYGVDIEKGAIDIARLRFWLAIVVDETNPTALPNLDYKIMQGNSLLESYRNVDLSHLMEDERYDDGTRQGTFFDDIIEDTREELTVLQRNYFDCSDHTEKKHIESDIKTVINTQLSARHIALDLAEIDNIAANQDFFLWHTWFSDVFCDENEDERGFDIVIANPPYIDSETMTRVMPHLRARYASLFSTASGNWDMFIVFVEQGYRLLAKKGVFSFIIPNKIIAAKYAVAIRELLASTKINEIRDYSRVRVFEEAAVYPCTVVGEKVDSEKKEFITRFTTMSDKTSIELSVTSPTISLQQFSYWDVFFNDEQTVERVLHMFANSKIEDFGDIEISGAATVAEAYIVKEHIFDAEQSRNSFKIINTGTIDPYKALWGVYPMQYIKGRYQYPRILCNAVKNMNVSRWEQARSNKIIVAGMSSRIEATIDNGEILAGKSTTILVSDNVRKLKVLLAVLNSDIVSWYMNIIFRSLKMAGGYLNYGVRELSVVPVPHLTNDEENTIIKAVDTILSTTDDVQFETTTQIINNLVADAFLR